MFGQSGFKKLMEPTASLNSVISDFKEQDRVSAETLNGLQSELGKLGGEIGNNTKTYTNLSQDATLTGNVDERTVGNPNKWNPEGNEAISS